MHPKQRRRMHAMTPEARMRKMSELQQQAFETLRKNPEGWDHFIRRNFRKRRDYGQHAAPADCRNPDQA